MRLYLVRHGETAQNASGRTQGTLNIPLNDVGRDQARKLRGHLQSEKIDAFYSSTLDRAYETAVIVADNKPVVKFPELCEIDYGDMEGIPYTELLEFRARKTVPFAELEYPGGESYRHAHERAKKFLSFIQKNHNVGDVILIVSHGSFNRVLLSEITGKTIETLYEEIPSQKNTAVTIIDFDENWVGQLIQAANAQHLDI